MTTPDMDEEEVTGMSCECPFCKGIVRTNAANTVVSHSRPECEKFEKMTPVDFLEAMKKSKKVAS